LVHQRPSVPGSLLIDCTHDNETPNQKRTAEDALPNAALVAMASCAIGSTRGYDELVPRNIDVVKEHRLYRSVVKDGILHVKQMLNKLHYDLAIQGFTEVHIHQGKKISYAAN
jgi:glycogen debranching enzyme